MVKAELSYNPYLRETEVRFNGQEPKINSIVEKYKYGILETWIDDIPEIFFNEMNGYDFEFEFSGTQLDYDELVRSFRDAGVSKDMVKLFYKNELGGREQKINGIDDLLKWMKKTGNERFDYNDFMSANEELFGAPYSLFIIQGSTVDTSVTMNGVDISVENFENVSELKGTDLTFIPIVFYISPENIMNLQDNVNDILCREDVKFEQLFFFVNKMIDAGKIERILRDLGIPSPRMISETNSPEIKRYFEIYPFTDYIYNAIRTLRESASGIESRLAEKNQKSQIKEKEVSDAIESINKGIEKLKEARDRFAQRDNLEVPIGYDISMDKLLSAVASWNSKKTKITNVEEAKALSDRLDKDVRSYYSTFISYVNKNTDKMYRDMLQKYADIYNSAGFDPQYHPDVKPIADNAEYTLKSVSEEVLKLKSEKYVDPKEEFWGHLLKPADGNKQDKVLITTYYCQTWREYVIKTLKPIAVEYISQKFEALCEALNELAVLYQKHIEELIEGQMQERSEYFSQLSKEEQELQTDNNWLAEFKDKLNEIERG